MGATVDSLKRFIKGSGGSKVELHVTSVNLEVRHREFIKRHRLNLSLMVRDLLDKLIIEVEGGSGAAGSLPATGTDSGDRD